MWILVLGYAYFDLHYIKKVSQEHHSQNLCPVRHLIPYFHFSIPLGTFFSFFPTKRRFMQAISS